MDCTNNPKPGLQRPGRFIRIPFGHTITTAGTVEEVKLAPPSGQRWKLVDIVVAGNSDAAIASDAVGSFTYSGQPVPPCFIDYIRDASQSDYLPRVGDRSDPTAELGLNVGVAAEALQQRFKSGPNTMGSSPLQAMDLPEGDASNPILIGWDTTASGSTVSGYYEVRVLAG